MPDTELIGSKRACDILGIDRATMIRWIADGKLAYEQKLPGSNGPYLFDEAIVLTLKAELPQRDDSEAAEATA